MANLHPMPKVTISSANAQRELLFTALCWACQDLSEWTRHKAFIEHISISLADRSDLPPLIRMIRNALLVSKAEVALCYDSIADIDLEKIGSSSATRETVVDCPPSVNFHPDFVFHVTAER